MEKELVEILMPVALAAISALASIATYALKIFADKTKIQASTIADDKARGIAYSLISDAQTAITTAVLETNQTLVNDLKLASSDGRLSQEEVTKAWNKTYERTKALLGEQILEELRKILPDAETWIIANIEATIARHK